MALLTIPVGPGAGRTDGNPRVANALPREQNERVISFSPASARLASATQCGAELVARISQRDLADAVGSVREVVVRIIRSCANRLEHTGRDGVAVIGPDGLLAVTGWNKVPDTAPPEGHP